MDAASAVKGKLTTAAAIPDSLTAGGYGPKKIPSWVARTSRAQTTKVAGQSQSGAQSEAAATSADPVATATPVDQVTKVAEDVQAPIAEVTNPVRLEPSLPVQQKPAKPALNVLTQAVNEPSPAVNAPS